MGNVNDADAGGLEVPDNLEKKAGFLLGQRRGRLIHDEHFRIKRQRLGNLHHLTLGDGEATDHLVGVDINTQPVETALGVETQLLAVNEETATRFARKIDVLGNGKMRNEVEFLVNDGDAGGFGFQR
ncbi:hypothetical protein D3C86_1169780 [compost metagenome]